MAYRGQDAADHGSAPTAGGALEITLGANRISLSAAGRSLHLVDRVATVTEVAGDGKKPRRRSYTVLGLVLARGFPREDLGLWIEAAQDAVVRPGRLLARAPRSAQGQATTAPVRSALRRIFGVSPVSLLEPEGLSSLGKLDALARRLRPALEDHASSAGLWSARGVEIGSGHDLDKALLADMGDHHAVYARKLFRDRARLLAKVHDGGHVSVPDGKVTREVRLTSTYGITVRGDYIRFADRHGLDLARIAVPWVGPEEREELARRLGQLVVRAR